MEFSKAISRLAREIGAPLEVEDGVCAFSVGSSEDDMVTIVLQDLEENGKVAFWSDQGVPDPGSLNELRRIALDANDLMRLTGGAVLSTVPGSGHFRLQRIETLDTLRVSGRPILEGFIDTAIKWHKMVVNGHAPEESPEPPPMVGGGAIFV